MGTPPPRPVHAFIFIAHRVHSAFVPTNQFFLCSSILIDFLLTHALTLSALITALRKKNSHYEHKHTTREDSNPLLTLAGTRLTYCYCYCYYYCYYYC